MTLKEQFEKETGYTISNANGVNETLKDNKLVSTNSTTYFIERIKWLEEKIKQITKKSSEETDEKSSSTKSVQELIFGGWYICNRCNNPVTDDNGCKKCGVS